MRPRRHRRNPPLALLANPRGAVLSREVHSLAYRHADDGKAYRHDFEGPVRARLNRDGSVTLRHEEGKPIWDDFTERPYLVNPKTARTRMARTTKKRSTRARRGKRPPPKGYGSWKAYMAAIRPGASAPKRARTSKEGPMARKKSKSRRRGKSVARRTVVVHTHKKTASRGRKRYHRNPPGMSGVLGVLTETALDTGVIVGGRAAARVVPQLLTLDTATAMGRGAQAALAVLAAGGLHMVGAAKWAPKVGAAILSVPAEAVLRDLVKDSESPLLASAFGDDTILLESYVQDPSLSGIDQQIRAIGRRPQSNLGSYVQQQ